MIAVVARRPSSSVNVAAEVAGTGYRGCHLSAVKFCPVPGSLGGANLCFQPSARLWLIRQDRGLSDTKLIYAWRMLGCLVFSLLFRTDYSDKKVQITCGSVILGLKVIKYSTLSDPNTRRIGD